MKIEIKVRNILIFVVILIATVLFINKSFAVNSAKVNVETANLRETADSNSKILELLSLNDEVQILDKQDAWYKVKAKGITGYLREDLVKVDKEQETTTASSQPETNYIEENATTIDNTNTTSERTETSDNEGAEKITSAQQKNNIKKKVKEDTRLKIVPVINATDIIEVKKDEEVTTTETINGWVCIETKTTKGWIREEKLKNIDEKQEDAKQEENNNEKTKQEEQAEAQNQEEKLLKTLFVNRETVNLRKEANTNSEIVNTLALNMAVDVYAEENGWSKVKVSGKDGYVSSNLLSEKKQETSRGAETPRKKIKENTENNQTGNADTTKATTTKSSGSGSSVVSTAKNYIGKASYVYGASGPNSFDCSGFTSYIYKQYGVSLSRTAAGQYSNGTSVSRSDLQPGDLVMFGSSTSSINHVGIYIGGGQIVHAANPSRGVTTDTINSGYYNNKYVGARRVM